MNEKRIRILIAYLEAAMQHQPDGTRPEMDWFVKTWFGALSLTAREALLDRVRAWWNARQDAAITTATDQKL